MKLKPVAVFLLAALTAWMFPPAKTVASQTKASLPEAIQITTPTNVIPDENQPRELVKKLEVSPVQSSNPSKGRKVSGRDYSKEEVQALIIQYSQQYGISADLPLRVANCESGFNQSSKNKNSTASGVFQYLASTWRNTESGRQGISVFDADANVHMAIKSIASGGISNWNASRSCWNK